jgi:hypothetical protein
MRDTAIKYGTGEAERLLAAANKIISEQSAVLAAAHNVLTIFADAADSHVELAVHCERARKVIARIEGRKPCAERKQEQRKTG